MPQWILADVTALSENLVGALTCMESMSQGLIAFICSSMGWAVHIVSGWDAAGLTLLALAWWRLFRDDAVQTRKHAAKEDMLIDRR